MGEAMRFQVSSPEPGYDGTVGSVTFESGVAVVDETCESELAYFRAHGYTVVEHDQPDPSEGQGDGDDDVVEMPKKSASTEAWRVYAVASEQLTADEAEQMTRDDLVAYFSEENQP